jgi:hypothetical protein
MFTIQNANSFLGELVGVGRFETDFAIIARRFSSYKINASPVCIVLIICIDEVIGSMI